MNEDETMLDELASLYNTRPEDLDESATGVQLLRSALKREENRYEDETFIARGGMKEVSKVYDPQTGRHVALAKLHADSPEELYEPFIREARLTALLDHPNIITVHDIGLNPDGSPYFTMELKGGQTLAGLVVGCKLLVDRESEISSTDVSSPHDFQRTNNKELSTRNGINQLLEIYLKICDAIAYAHSHNILHLDLKPENIQVGRFGEVIVCDWGLGKMIGDNEYDGGDLDRLLLSQDLLYNMTLAGHIKGTPGFMAPEQIQPDGEKTVQTDIYALGALLYTILCKEPPVSGNTEQILEKTLAADIIPPAQRFPYKTIPTSLSAVAMKALALDPTQRYQSVESLRTDVHNYLTGYATSAENAGIVKELKLLYQRNRSMCRLAALFCVVLATLTTLFFYNLNQSRLNTEQERKRSEAMRIRAEKSVQMYEQQRAKMLRLNKLRSQEVENDARPFRYHFFFANPQKYIREAMNRMNRALELDPSNLEAQALIGNQYFIMQDFERANAVFKKSDYKEEDLYPLSIEYAKKPKDKNKRLSVQDFSELIARVGHDGFRNHLCERMTVYHTLKGPKQHASYAQIVHTLLRAWSVKHKKDPLPFTFDYNPKTKHLALHGKGISTTFSDSNSGSGKSLLRFIPVNTLDISRTKIYNLDEITEIIHLKELDIRDTLITSLKPLKDLPVLHTLIIASDQFSKEHLADLPDRINVVVKYE